MQIRGVVLLKLQGMTIIKTVHLGHYDGRGKFQSSDNCLSFEIWNLKMKNSSSLNLMNNRLSSWIFPYHTLSTCYVIFHYDVTLLLCRY